MAKKQTIREADLGLFGPLILESILQGTEVPTRRKYAGVRIDFATWLGREPSPTERVALSRTITRLECLGLVSRLQGRRLVLTKAGKRLIDTWDGLPEKLSDAEIDAILAAPIDAQLLAEGGNVPKSADADAGKPSPISLLIPNPAAPSSPVVKPDPGSAL